MIITNATLGAFFRSYIVQVFLYGVATERVITPNRQKDDTLSNAYLCPPFINLESVEPLQWEIRKFDEFCTNKEFYLMTCGKLLVSLQLLLKEWIDDFNENRIERIVDLPRR